VRHLSEWRDIEEPTIRDRPIGLLAIGTLSAIAGVAIALASVELFLGAARYADWLTPRLVGNDLVGMVKVYPEHYLLVGAILLVPAVLLLAFAIGIVRRRPWAWIIGFVAGGLIAMYGVLALVIPADLPSNADRWHLAAGVPWILAGVVLLRYFDRRPVRSDLGWGDASIG
jgi:hypothetical protein